MEFVNRKAALSADLMDDRTADRDYDFKKNTATINYKVIASILALIFLFVIGGVYFKSPSESVAPYIQNQWRNFYLMSGVFDSFNVRLILFDVEVLPEVIKPRREIWQDPAYTCRVLCKHHPDGNNLITFAVLARNFIPEQKNIITRLVKVGFVAHLSKISDPGLNKAKNTNETETPSYLWIARKDHVIQIVILHERHEDYYWAGAVTDKDWVATVNALKQEMTIEWETLNGAVFPRYAQAYDKSYHLTGVTTKIDSHVFVVPYRIKKFLQEHEKSYFLECDRKAASSFRKSFPAKLIDDELIIRKSARDLLFTARKVLNKMNIPFWISGETLLGWYRECDVIPHSADVNIGMSIRDYRHEIIDNMEKSGLLLKSIFGKVEDSYEISFVYPNNVKLNVIFFYDEDNYSWYGRTRAHDGAKFQFIFPKFTHCWTEFLEMKVGTPCESRSYIEAYYGSDWRTPAKNWVWHSSPPNVLPNGFWAKSHWDEVIQVFEFEKVKTLSKKEL